MRRWPSPQDWATQSLASRLAEGPQTNSFLNFLVKPGETPLFLANVTFEPGCRNNWHIHHAESGGSQMLICTTGGGWFQLDGEPAVSLQEGSIAYIPTGRKHWHGAKADSWFSHISVEIPDVKAASSGWWRSPTRPTTSSEARRSR